MTERRKWGLVILLGLAIGLVLYMMELRDEKILSELERGVTHEDVSTDGRYHKCGLVTEHGVTEYLDTYRERCREG